MKHLKILSLFLAGLIIFRFSCSDLAKAPDKQPGDHIVVYGDSRSNSAAHTRVVKAIEEIRPKTVFHTGDLVADGSNAVQWEIFNAITADLRFFAAFYPALGNHENNSPLYFNNFKLPNNERWYSIAIDQILFIILDSNSDCSEESEQYLWLKNELEQVGDTIAFVITVFHHPPYSTGPHIEDEMGLRETFVPLFEQYGVDAVFTGHDHIYERTVHNGIYYIVTGGGGAPLYDQARYSPESLIFIKAYHFCRLSGDKDRLVIDIFTPDLETLDHFTVNRKLR
ncbi:MAG: metallophosphoesterase [Candidatus Zixiibacteriota bacterium]|nr:MAG: metallophosphoesterase [candidate division Zixibacteria bacterium]